MARFRAVIQGQRGEASRLGGKSSGIDARVNGWHSGVNVVGRYDEKEDADVFHVYATGGSGGNYGSDLIATVKEKDGRVVVVPPHEPEPRRAYFIDPAIVDEKGDFIVCIAEENTPGYCKTDWTWGKDLKIAQKCADEKNAALGLDKKAAFLVVASSMGAQKRRDAVERIKEAARNLLDVLIEDEVNSDIKDAIEDLRAEIED